MPDYNIYIHSDTGSGVSNNPTKPWKSAESESDGGAGGWQSKFKSAVNAITNPDSLVAKATNTAMKAIPSLAVAYFVVKSADKIVTDTITYIANETGEYRTQLGWENFKTVATSVFRPFSNLRNYIFGQQQQSLANQKIAQHRALLGDIVINNSAGGKGV